METIICEHCGYEYDRHIGCDCPNCGHTQEYADDEEYYGHKDKE